MNAVMTLPSCRKSKNQNNPTSLPKVFVPTRTLYQGT